MHLPCHNNATDASWACFANTFQKAVWEAEWRVWFWWSVISYSNPSFSTTLQKKLWCGESLNFSWEEKTSSEVTADCIILPVKQKTKVSLFSSTDIFFFLVSLRWLSCLWEIMISTNMLTVFTFLAVILGLGSQLFLDENRETVESRN